MPMTETSGTAGGYTGTEEDKSACLKSLAEMGKEHLCDEAGTPKEGHSLQYHAESKAVRHAYPEDEDATQHEPMYEKMKSLPGVNGEDPDSVEHGPGEAPEEEGWTKAFPLEGEPEKVSEKPEPANATGEEEKGLPKGVLGKLLRILPRALSKRAKSTLAGNVKKLRKKGYKPRHASAIAYAVAAKAVDPMGDVPGDEEDLGDEVTEGLDEPEIEVKSEAGTLTQGAQLVQRLLEVLEEDAPLLEQEELKELVNEFQEVLSEAAMRIYPDVDFGGVSKGEMETPGQETNDEQTTQAAMDKYSLGAMKRLQSVQSNAFWRRVQVKRMSRATCGVIKEAAEHLGDMAEMPVGSQIKTMHCKACAMHSKALTQLHTKMQGEDAEGQLDETGVEKGLDTGAVLKALDRVKEKQAGISKDIYAATGKKV